MMVSLIEEVLTEEDISKVEAVKGDIRDLSEARLFNDKAFHLCCEDSGGEVKVELYGDLRSPYLHSKAFEPKEPEMKVPKRKDQSLLYRARKSFVEKHGKIRRWEILKEEINLREREILTHQYKLNKNEGVNILLASACWLIEESVKWYTLCARNYRTMHYDFEFRGLERGIDIFAPDKEGNLKHHILIKNHGMREEEMAAQFSGGVGKILDCGSYDIDCEKAAKAREGLVKLEFKKLICVLKGKL
jgi:hypothetical protein